MTFFPDPNDCVYLDIETDMPSNKEFSDKGQLAMREIVCIAARHQLSTRVIERQEDLPFLIEFIKDKPIVGHNIFRFDAPLLKRLWGYDMVANHDVFDTMLMSKISEFKRNSHSLASYEDEIDITKLPLSTSTAEMIARCMADTAMTREVYKLLLESKQKLEIPDNPYKLEFRVAEIIARQHSHGISFDFDEAANVRRHIEADMEFIRRAINDSIPLVPAKVKSPPKVQFLKSGEPSAAIHKYVEAHRGSIVKRGNKYFAEGKSADDSRYVCSLPLEHSLPSFVELDIDSPNAVKEFLKSKGWVPTMWNYNSDKVRTSPKLWDDNKELCPNISKLGLPIISRISEYLTLRNRLNVLKGWMENSRVEDEHLICSDADTIGAVTARFTHKIVANVPRSTSTFGKEMRSLFRARHGNVMVGWDASSLEARMEAHYTSLYDGGEYAKELLEGDIHTKNQTALSLPTRDRAKTFKYAITYGASANKLASTFGWPEEHAEKLFAEFWKANPALRQLAAAVQKVSTSKGWIRAIDGRPIPVESKHSALNRLLQSAGAITMKYAMIIADRDIRKAGLDAHGLIRYHDEEQWECNPRCAEAVGKIGVNSIKAAGKYLRLNVPLDGEFKIGKNWSETH